MECWKITLIKMKLSKSPGIKKKDFKLNLKLRSILAIAGCYTPNYQFGSSGIPITFSRAVRMEAFWTEGYSTRLIIIINNTVIYKVLTHNIQNNHNSQGHLATGISHHCTDLWLTLICTWGILAILFLVTRKDDEIPSM